MMLRTRIIQFYNWLLSVETVKTSIVHLLLYLWLTIGIIGVLVLQTLKNQNVLEDDETSIKILLGGFWWQPWIVLVLSCCAMFFISQWMIFGTNVKRIIYSGYIIIAGADIGELLAVIAFYIALYAKSDTLDSSGQWFRMAMSLFVITALIVFIIRDIYRLAIIEVIRINQNGRRLD